jgi:hypothetical protein
MTAPHAQQDRVLQHLERAYLGPRNGDEEVITSRPDVTYMVGSLYPDAEGAEPRQEDAGVDEGQLAPARVDETASSDDGFEAVVESANYWEPTSCGLSFITTTTPLRVHLTYGTYERVTDERTGWKRTPAQHVFELDPGDNSWTSPDGRANVRAKRRPWAPGTELITVAVCNPARSGGSPSEDAARCLYQVSLTVEPSGGEILPYRNVEDLAQDPEREELALRYRHRKVYAVGHGTSVDWKITGGRCHLVRVDPLPRYVVPKVLVRHDDSPALQLAYLETIEIDPSGVSRELHSFVDGYDAWAERQEAVSSGIGDEFNHAPKRIIDRQRHAVGRMRAGIEALAGATAQNARNRRAFHLAMTAMRMQMTQSAIKASQGQLSAPKDVDPTWRPFQLGFILLCLNSVSDENSEDRDLVDLIWFPTGGGKTEAYLGLAAYEIFRRRLTHGTRGFGTSVITRYTLRLLTIQQFQRAATLICAMELMRRADPSLTSLGPFSIGLWVGNKTTPGTEKAAIEAYDAMMKQQEPTNPFQVDECPWCGSPMIPKVKSDPSAYGASKAAGRLILRCPASCDFADSLPLEVVDERIYSSPPTILVATVDKFARLPFVAAAGHILGTAPASLPPSLIIQDEMHLLSGPLGTTVAIYDAAVMGVVQQMGGRPKVVASTATIRAASSQVQGLMGRPVSLFPPSGIDEDDSYFASTRRPGNQDSQPDPSNFSPIDEGEEGRLYIGLMPQAFTQARSVVLALGAMLETPELFTGDGDDALDAYWTVVAYHNSLRELGRTVTLVRDDVRSHLSTSSGNAKGGTRTLRPDGLVELTGRVEASELPKSLRRLDRRVTSGDAVDVVACTNMLSVGIDVPRLALMLMNGQPKTTSEYIQATSRVGRGAVDGVIVTLYRATRPRDRSHYENFANYHQSLYRHVEPTSVTPWSRASRHRSLPAVLVALVRQLGPWKAADTAGTVDFDSGVVKNVEALIARAVRTADPREESDTLDELHALLLEWRVRAERCADDDEHLLYEPRYGAAALPALTRDYSEDHREGWVLQNSMRSVDAEVAMWIEGEDQ